MTLKYKQAVLIQNLVDATSVPIGQPEESSMRIATQMLIPKQARLTFTNTSVTITAATGETSVESIQLPDRNIMLLGFNMNLTITKGNAVDGIVAATAINIGLGTAAASDNLMNSVQDTTVALTFTHQAHSNGGTREYVKRLEPSTSIYLVLATDGTPTADDTLTVTGTLDIFYFDLSKPGL